MFTIEKISAIEILDSRGRPTLKATCSFASGAAASASVPSGASTGSAEAMELRDGDARRYRGLGCRNAARLINVDLNSRMSGARFASQGEWDVALLAWDGTGGKSRCGANTILAASIAFARAAAAQMRVPLHAYFSSITGTKSSLPRPMINLFSGGKHAGGQVPVQDVLVAPMPTCAATTGDVLAVTFEVYQRAADLCAKKYGARALCADEGGLAPPFPSVEAMFEDATLAITQAGFQPGKDVALLVDVAASHFCENGRYHLGGDALDSQQMIDKLARWTDRFPIISWEDGLAEDDWDHWPRLCATLGQRALVIGDDLLCTNPGRIARAVKSHAANALLLKVNQVGALTEAAEAHRCARAAGWNITISARSGETEDDWLADLAVGWAADYIKIGSITRSERLAKYNRLLEIEGAHDFLTKTTRASL